LLGCVSDLFERRDREVSPSIDLPAKLLLESMSKAAMDPSMLKPSGLVLEEVRVAECVASLLVKLTSRSSQHTFYGRQKRI
jgi:hypothetical protein